MQFIELSNPQRIARANIELAQKLCSECHCVFTHYLSNACSFRFLVIHFLYSVHFLANGFFLSSAAPFLIYCSLARSLSACLRTTTMKLNFITLGIPIANSLHWEFSFQSIANNLDACRSSTMKCLQFHLFLKMKFCADFESITVHL